MRECLRFSHLRDRGRAVSAGLRLAARLNLTSADVALFFVGNATWKFRITPDAPGHWAWHSDCAADTTLEARGAVNCTGSARRGAIERSPAHPQFFRFASGDAFVPIGLEMDALFLFCIQQGLAATRSLLDDVRSVGVNYLLVQLYYNFSSWTTLPANQPPRVTPSPLTPWPSHTRDTLQIAYI
jgi:hypothetical protein